MWLPHSVKLKFASFAFRRSNQVAVKTTDLETCAFSWWAMNFKIFEVVSVLKKHHQINDRAFSTVIWFSICARLLDSIFLPAFCKDWMLHVLEYNLVYWHFGRVRAGLPRPNGEPLWSFASVRVFDSFLSFPRCILRYSVNESRVLETKIEYNCVLVDFRQINQVRLISFPSEFEGPKIFFSIKKKPIAKLKVINELQNIVCLSDGVLAILNFTDLEVLLTFRWSSCAHGAHLFPLSRVKLTISNWKML